MVYTVYKIPETRISSEFEAVYGFVYTLKPYTPLLCIHPVYGFES